jgi:AraC-like DNA-binding protein
VERSGLIWQVSERICPMTDVKGDCEVVAVVWPAELVAAALGTASCEALCLANACRVVPSARARAILHLVSDVEGQPEDVREAGLIYLLVRLAAEYFGHGANRPAQLHPAVSRALDIIEQTGGGFGIPELSERAGVSYGYLCRLFKAELGTSPKSLQQRARLERVIEGLDFGESLKDVAQAAGFGSYPQFFRVFRQHFGMGPREYLRRKYPLGPR